MTCPARGPSSRARAVFGRWTLGALGLVMGWLSGLEIASASPTATGSVTYTTSRPATGRVTYGPPSTRTASSEVTYAPLVPRGGAQYGPLHPRRRRARLQIDNRYHHPVRIFLDGRFAGLLRRRQLARYRHLRAGPVLLEARGLDGRLVHRVTLQLQRRTRLRFVLLPNRAQLRLINARSAPVNVSVDNARTYRLEPYASLELRGVPRGPHTLAARLGDELVQSGTVFAERGRTTSWLVRASSARVRVANHTVVPLRISVDGVARPGVVHPGQERIFMRVPTGTRALLATDLAGRALGVRALQLVPNEIRVWVIR